MQFKKQMKIMAEYGHGSIWIKSKEDDIMDPIDQYYIDEMLGKNSALGYDIMRHGQRYNSKLNHYYPPESSFWSFQESLEFEKLGYSIRERLYAKFHNEYDITYQSDLLSDKFTSLDVYHSYIKHIAGGPFPNGETISGTLHGIVFTPDEVRV